MGGGLEGVDYARLPCLHHFVHGAVFEVESDCYLAQGVQPGQFAGLFEGGESGFVGCLERGDFWGDVEGFGVEGGPEEVG